MKRAMILAAGRGERMGELTLETPKPLLKVGGQYLIEYALAKIKQAGIQECVINISWHADKIKSALRDGAQYGLKILYSEEPERLETGGGIFQALPLLGSDPFLVMSGDIVSDYPLNELPQHPEGFAHLVFVPNPGYHTQGDYGLKDGKVTQQAQPFYTYANVGVFRPELFANCEPGYFRLTQVLNPAIAAGKITGELYRGFWHNIGSPADIEEFKQQITSLDASS
jgi:MurNAc alpha-1-phosphate uridylyltransferase